MTDQPAAPAAETPTKDKPPAAQVEQAQKAAAAKAQGAAPRMSPEQQIRYINQRMKTAQEQLAQANDQLADVQTRYVLVCEDNDQQLETITKLRAERDALKAERDALKATPPADKPAEQQTNGADHTAGAAT